jgi:hypothetical protein
MRNHAVLQQLEQDWRAAVASLPAEGLARTDWLRTMPPPAPSRPAALFAELEDTRRQWQELRAWQALREHADSKVNPGWTYKDLLAHLASWAQEFHRQMATAAEGREFDYEIPFQPKIGPTEWNAIEVAKRREMTLDEIFDQFDAAFAASQDLILSLRPEQLRVTTRFPIRMGPEPMVANIPRMVAMKCWHNHYHFAQIRQRLAALLQEPRERHE